MLKSSGSDTTPMQPGFRSVITTIFCDRLLLLLISLQIIAGIPYLVLIDKKGNFRMAKIGGNAKNMQAIEAMIKELLAE